MTVAAPPKPPRSPEVELVPEADPLEALIEEARQRARRRRRRYGAAALLAALIGLAAIVGLTRGASQKAQASTVGGDSLPRGRLPAGEIALTRFDNVMPPRRRRRSHVVLWARSGVRELPIEGRAFGWSPDGSRLLVQRSSSLYVVRAGGTHLVFLAREANGFDAVWSPDSTRVALDYGSKNRFRSIEIVDARTGERHHIAGQVFDGGWYSGDVTWSPDGANILFVGRTGASGRAGLFIAAADASSPPRAFGDRASIVRPIQPAWSPDGSKIAFAGRDKWGNVGGLFVMNADGTDVHLIAEGGHGPVWSPDGSMIAFRGNRYEVIRPDGTGRMRLGGRGGWSGVTWSRDGRWLAEVGHAGQGVWLVSADGTRAVQVLHTPHAHYVFPLWRGGTATTEAK